MKSTQSLSLSRETIISILARVTLLLAGFIGIIYFARNLPPGELGTYFFVVALSQIIQQFTEGLSKAIKKRVSEVNVNPREYFGFGLLSHFTYSVLILIVATVVHLSGVYNVVNFPFYYSYWMVGIIATSGLFVLTSQLYAGIGYPGLSMWTNTIRNIGRVVIQILFVAKGFGVVGLFSGFIISNIVMAAIISFTLDIWPRLPTKKTINRTVSFAKWSIPNVFFQRFYSRVDVLLIGVLVGGVAVSQYETALKLTTPAIFISVSLGNVLVVKTSGLSSINEDAKNELQRSIGYAGLLSIPMFFGTLVVGQELLTVTYGPAYEEAWPVLIGLGLFQVVNTYRIPFARFFDGIDRPRLNTKVNVITIIIHLVLAIYLGMDFGLIGIVIATIIAETLRVSLYLFISYRKYSHVFINEMVIHQVFSGVAMFFVLNAIKRRLQLDLLLLITFILGGGVIYFTLLVLSNDEVRRSSREVVNKVSSIL